MSSTTNTDAEIIQWIVKGGPGSGPQPGHDFNGNQWTGQGATRTPASDSMWRNADGTPSYEKVSSYMSQTPDGLSIAGQHAAAAQIAQSQNMTANTYDERVQQVGDMIPQHIADGVTPHDMAILEDENYHATTIALIAKNPSLENFPALSSFRGD